MMKKFCVIACLLLAGMSMQAQHQVISFFDELGTAKIRTEEYSTAHDTIVMIDHRYDDVIWSRYVYRIIDMRYKQNYQLYFPTRADDPDYRSLFCVIRDAVIDGLEIYPASLNSIKPDFKQEPFDKPNICKNVFLILSEQDMLELSEEDEDLKESRAMLINYDSITDIMTPQNAPYAGVVRNQLKYLIQEVTFFDKHTSRMHTKIMAIAPLHPYKIKTNDSTKIMTSLKESILCWIPFDNLRPYLAMQYAIPNRNETKHVTFDEFFQKRLFSSYIVGEGNMYNRWIPDYEYNNVEGLQKEQERIATELLNFEQDLWEY